MAAIPGPAARVPLGPIFAFCKNRLAQNTKSFTNHSIPSRTTDQRQWWGPRAAEVPKPHFHFSQLCFRAPAAQTSPAVFQQGFQQDLSLPGPPAALSWESLRVVPGHSTTGSSTQTRTASLPQLPKTSDASLSELLPDIPGKKGPWEVPEGGMSLQPLTWSYARASVQSIPKPGCLLHWIQLLQSCMRSHPAGVDEPFLSTPRSKGHVGLVSWDRYVWCVDSSTAASLSHHRHCLQGFLDSPGQGSNACSVEHSVPRAQLPSPSEWSCCSQRGWAFSGFYFCKVAERISTYGSQGTIAVLCKPDRPPEHFSVVLFLITGLSFSTQPLTPALHQ